MQKVQHCIVMGCPADKRNSEFIGDICREHYRAYADPLLSYIATLENAPDTVVARSAAQGAAEHATCLCIKEIAKSARPRMLSRIYSTAGGQAR